VVFWGFFWGRGSEQKSEKIGESEFLLKLGGIFFFGWKDTVNGELGLIIDRELWSAFLCGRCPNGVVEETQENDGKIDGIFWGQQARFFQMHCHQIWTMGNELREMFYFIYVRTAQIFF
jgi:hypothetical protein